MYNYYDAKFLVKYLQSMVISKALLKHGYSNFTFEILEYCEPSNVIAREQHFIDLFKPEYNILKTAGSSFGYKHTEDTLAKLRARRHTEETLAKLRAFRHSEETKRKMSEAKIGKKRAEGAGRPSQQIEVFDNE